jgi:hypothetical protein
MTIHPLVVFAIGAGLFICGVCLMIAVYTRERPATEPEYYSISVSQPGEYLLKVYRDGSGATILNRVR